MRILYWIDLYSPHVGGVEVFTAKLIPALQKRGHEVAIVTSHRQFQLPDKSLDNNIPVYRFNFWEALEKRNLKQSITICKQIAQLKQDFQPDLVHLHFGATSYFHLQTMKAYLSPTLTTIHAVPSASLSSPQSFLYKMLQNSDWVNTVSPQGLDKMRDYIPEITPHSSVIYYGLELPTIQPKTPCFDPPTLLCLGRLVPQKGFDVALDAFASLLKRFPQIRLVIAGDGSERTTLINQAKELGIETAVDFKGLVAPEKVPALLNQATMVLLPSRFEGLPLVALQAAQMSRPIVATNVDGLPKLVINQQTGMLIDKDNVTALSDAIAFCLENPHQTIKMGRVARERFQEIFSMDSCVNNYDALYRQIIQKNNIK
ncbi:MAG: glycosyltransferase family 4 protein [Rivularia sp. (in: cyanobacteria)]